MSDYYRSAGTVERVFFRVGRCTKSRTVDRLCCWCIWRWLQLWCAIGAFVRWWKVWKLAALVVAALALMLAGYPLASLAVTGIAAGVLAIGGLYLLACRREERRWRANKP